MIKQFQRFLVEINPNRIDNTPDHTEGDIRRAIEAINADSVCVTEDPKVWVLWYEDSREDGDNRIYDVYFDEQDAIEDMKTLYENELSNLEDNEVVESFFGDHCSYIECHDGEIQYHVTMGVPRTDRRMA